MKRSKKGILIRLSLTLLVICLIILLSYLICHKLGYTKLDKESLRDIIEKTGVWGPLVFIAISFLQVTFIPIPSIITIIGGSLLFGPLLSILYSFIGILLGSLLAFALGRWVGRKFVNWILGDKETVDNYLNKIKSKENVVLFFMFLLPVFPDDALCALAGVTSMSLKTFIIMQIITRIISISLTVFFGSGEIIPYNAMGFTIMGIIVVISVIIFVISIKYADKINSFFSKGKNKKQNKDDEM